MFGQFHRTFSVFVIVQRERLCLSSRCRQASFAVFGWSSSWKWQSNKTFGLCWTSLPEQGAFSLHTEKHKCHCLMEAHVESVSTNKSFSLCAPPLSLPPLQFALFQNKSFRRHALWLQLTEFKMYLWYLIFYKSEYIKWTQPMFNKNTTNFQRYIFSSKCWRSF